MSPTIFLYFLSFLETFFDKKIKSFMGRKKKNNDEKKPSLTLNINENLLLKIDKIVEDTGDNRSRLIERLMSDYVEKNMNKLTRMGLIKLF